MLTNNLILFLFLQDGDYSLTYRRENGQNLAPLASTPLAPSADVRRKGGACADVSSDNSEHEFVNEKNKKRRGRKPVAKR